MKHKQHIQKRAPTPFERCLGLGRVLSESEKLAVMKAFAAELRQPIYTATEVRQIVNQALAQQQQRQPLMGSIDAYQQALQRMRAR